MQIVDSKNYFKDERLFLILILLLMVFSALIYKHTSIAMWFGFALAGYSVIANDSIQTIGTFFASNKKVHWYFIWLYLAVIFLCTTFYSWLNYNGDVTYGRLFAKGFEQFPNKFDYLQLASPIFLLIITYLKMPISTTFLILSSFSNKISTIIKIALKSISGYLLAFIVSLFSWFGIKKFIDKYGKEKAHFIWYPIQWITSGLLWSVWFMQDAANIAVYLPRQLALYQLVFFLSIIIVGFGFLVYFKGGRIQYIVLEKAYITDVRHATFVDAIYAFILFFFKEISKMPMSTTWVFLGNLAGRELSFSIMGYKKYKRTRKIIFRDISYALIGLIISLFIAAGVNDQFRKYLFSW